MAITTPTAPFGDSPLAPSMNETSGRPAESRSGKWSRDPGFMLSPSRQATPTPPATASDDMDNPNTPNDATPPVERRRHDPDPLVQRAMWVTPKLAALGFLATLAVVVFMPEAINYNTGLIVLFVFACCLNLAIVVPIASMILYWNRRLFGSLMRSRP